MAKTKPTTGCRVCGSEDGNHMANCPKAPLLTLAEMKTLDAAMNRIWAEIGCDCLEARAWELPKAKRESVTIPAKQVRELVFDCGRLEHEMETCHYDEPRLLQFVRDAMSWAPGTEAKRRLLDRIAKQAFPTGRYGY